MSKGLKSNSASQKTLQVLASHADGMMHGDHMGGHDHGRGDHPRRGREDRHERNAYGGYPGYDTVFDPSRIWSDIQPRRDSEVILTTPTFYYSADGLTPLAVRSGMPTLTAPTPPSSSLLPIPPITSAIPSTSLLPVPPISTSVVPSTTVASTPTPSTIGLPYPYSGPNIYTAPYVDPSFFTTPSFYTPPNPYIQPYLQPYPQASMPAAPSAPATPATATNKPSDAQKTSTEKTADKSSVAKAPASTGKTLGIIVAGAVIGAAAGYLFAKKSGKGKAMSIIIGAAGGSGLGFGISKFIK